MKGYTDFSRRILCDCKQISESESEYTNCNKKKNSLNWLRESYTFFATKKVSEVAKRLRRKDCETSLKT